MGKVTEGGETKFLNAPQGLIPAGRTKEKVVDLKKIEDRLIELEKQFAAIQNQRGQAANIVVQADTELARLQGAYRELKQLLPDSTPEGNGDQQGQGGRILKAPVGDSGSNRPG